MNNRKRVLAVVGSASEGSSNLHLVEYIRELLENEAELLIYDSLQKLPHFSPALSIADTPEAVIHFRKSIEEADGILISTPEYIFSIPSLLKNALEWCVSTTIFSDKPVGIITASAQGQKGHEELQLIIQTIQAKIDPDALLLIPGIKGKMTRDGTLSDEETISKLKDFAQAFINLIRQTGSSKTRLY